MAKKVSETKTDLPKAQEQGEDVTGENIPVVQKSADKKTDLVNTALVEEAVQFINEKSNETVYRGSLEIGSYILREFFQNDIDLAGSRNPHKSASYNALCNRTDLVVDPATLSVMVRVASQEKFFEIEGIKTEGLSYTHKAELVKLPNEKAKTALVQRALQESFTTRQLAEEVKKIKEKPSADEPKTALLLAAVERCIANPARLFDHPGRSAFISTTANLKKMKADTRQKLYEKTLSMIEQTKEWTKRYEALKKQLEKIEGGKPTGEASSE